jgi:hypothetical protein
MEIKIVTNGNWSGTYLEVDGKKVNNVSRISLWAGNDREYTEPSDYVELSYTTKEKKDGKEEGERAMAKEVTMRFDTEKEDFLQAGEQEVVELNRRDRVRKLFWTEDGDGNREEVKGYIG